MDAIDACTLGAFSYLKNHALVCDVDCKEVPGTTSAQFAVWEQKNAPYSLPDDMKRFYATTNGLSIRWYSQFQGRKVAVGHFFVNSLSELARIKIERIQTLVSPSDMNRLSSKAIERDVIGFVLENQPKYGVVAILDLEGEEQVWFRDLNGTWSFLANSFSSYFRLMIAHFGIFSWQGIFSGCGPDPLYEPWLHLFAARRMQCKGQIMGQAMKEKA